MSKLMMFFATAAALVLATMASAQTNQQQLAAGPSKATTITPSISIPVAPVQCIAHGYFSGGSITLILNKLDAARNSADVDAINTFGVTLKKDSFDRNGGAWTFANGVLKYDRPNAIRWELTVEDRRLVGSYWNSCGVRCSVPNIVLNCNDSTKRIIVQ